MTVTTKLAIVCSLLVAAGCTHSNKQTKYGSSGTYSGTPYYGNATTQPIPESSVSGTTGSGTFESPVAAQVKQTLTADPTLALVAPQIQIKDENGKVTLMGTVANEQQKQIIETLAKSTTGVTSVDNQLQVSLQPTSDRSGQSSRIYSNATEQVVGANPGQPANDQNLSPTSDRPNSPSRIYSTNQTPSTVPPSTVPEGQTFSANIQGATEADQTLAKQMTEAFKADPALTPLLSSVKVNINDGKAILTGTVKSEDEKNKIESALQSISGVTSVDNQLQVSASADTPENK